MRLVIAVPLLLGLLISSTACTSAGPQAVRRNLPAAQDVVRDPVPLPRATAGMSATVFAGRALVAADEGNKRLIESRQNYEAVRRTYGGQ